MVIKKKIKKLVKKKQLKVSGAPKKRRKAIKTVNKDMHRVVNDEKKADVGVKIKEIIASGMFSDYVSRTVGGGAKDVLDFLSYGPQIDEKIAERLNIKINEVRRMLNSLNVYGIVRYEVNKDKKGWLTFRWYIDQRSLDEFYRKLGENESSSKETLPENCNDFFICSNCYKNQKVIFPFDAAYESSFKCECGKSLKMLDREEALRFLSGVS